MRSREEFWMVYGMGQRQPTVRHKSFLSAKEEATRLARVNPGIDFFIMESVGVSRRVDVDYQPIGRGARDHDDEIPF